MNKYIAFFFALSSIVVLADSCKSSKDTTSQPTTETDPLDKLDLEEIAQAKFGSSFDLQYNSSKSFVLVSKKLKTRPNDAYPTVRFFIYETRTKEIIYENTEAGGTVEWESDDVILVTSKNVIPNPNGSSGPKTYRYDTKTRKKYSGKFLKNKDK